MGGLVASDPDSTVSESPPQKTLIGVWIRIMCLLKLTSLSLSLCVSV